MWNLYQKATKYSQLPSTIFGEENPLAAWMLDSAVTWFGITIENALQERVKVGTESRPRYSLTQLLDKNFFLPKPIEVKQDANPWAALMAWAGKSKAVRWWKYVPPAEKEKTDE